MPCNFDAKGICKDHDSNYALCHKYTAEIMTEMWEAKKAYNEAAVERDRMGHKLLNLLALIHRDGGHYTSEHGLEKSYLDAAEIRGQQLNALDVLEKALSKIREYTTMHQTWCQRVPACSCGLLNATNAAHNALQEAKKCDQPIMKGYRPVILNEYQARNLLWLINMCGYPHTEGVQPFTFACNGDWIGEIAIKVAHLFSGDNLVPGHGNSTREELIKQVRHWLTYAKPEEIGGKAKQP